jgi:hypothetical protein
LAASSADISALVVDDCAGALRHPAKGVIVVQPGGPVVVDHDLDRYTQFATVAENALVMVRQPRRTGVEIKMIGGFPGDTLRRVDFLDSIAAAQGPVAPARPRSRFEHATLVPGLAEFQRRHHPGDAGAEDHDAGAIAGRQGRRPGIGGRHRQETHRRHRLVDGGNPTRFAHEIEEATPRQGRHDGDAL